MPANATSPTGPPRVTGTWIVVGLALMVLCPALTLWVASANPSRGPAPYALIGLLYLLFLAYLLAGAVRWVRPTRASQPRDATPLLPVVVGTGLTLGLLLVLATAHGIRGSALPRVLQGVRHGIPLSVDLLYLSACTLALLVLVATAASGAVLLLHAAPVQRALGWAEGGLQAATERLTAESAAIAEGTAWATPPARTGPSDGYLRRQLSPASRVLLVAGAAVTLGCVLLFSLGDISADTAELLTIVATFAPVPGMAWAVLASLWRRDEEFGVVMGALWRTTTVPVTTAVLCFLPTLVAVLLPPVWQGFAAQQLSAIGDGGLVAPGTPPPGWVGMSALVALAIGMLSGLAISVAVVMPVVAIFMPQVMIVDNQMSTSPEHRRQNTAAVRAITAFVVLTFVFATLITGADPGDVRFWLAIACLVLIVALVAFTYRTQRVDHAARRASGTQALVPNPADPDSTHIEG